VARYEKRRWESGEASGLPRRDRRSCDYEAYVPDPLVGRAISLGGDVAADVADAERALATFDHEAHALASTEALARLLLRAESVASSRIEGLEVGGRRLLHAEAANALGEASTDVTAAEVLANIDAMAWGVGQVGPGDELTVDLLLEAHRRLLADTRLRAHGGHIRREQNWIGGSSYHPCSAAFVPPPPELVGDLLEDLCTFCNGDDLPAVVQAAVAHAQFETIHPFVDGNGRIGRCLIHLVLRRRGLSNRTLAPISLILATWSQSYIDGLIATRYLGSADGAEASVGVNQWLGLFATACRRAVEDASTFEDAVNRLERRWRERLGRVRADSSVDLLLRALPGAPVLTVTGAASLIGRSYQATNQAVARLVDASILRPIRLGRRNRAFEAPDVITMFASLERRLASPTGDTRAAPPSRRVPRRH